MRTEPLGTIICTEDSPSTEKIEFVIGNHNELSTEKQIPVHVGQYVSIDSIEGLVIAHIEQVYKTNRYFSQIDAVHEFTRSGKAFGAIFPIDRWEYVLAEAKPLGLYTNRQVQRVTYPPSPGAIVSVPDPKILGEFLGFSKGGIHLGHLLFHDIPAIFDLSKMYQKHVALLAMSGAGKSYAAAVMLEELLSRKSPEGRPAILVIDVHGEYTGLTKSQGSKGRSFEEQITIIRSPLVEIATPRMSAKAFATYSPDMGTIQVRELTRIIRTLRTTRKGQPYDIGDLTVALEHDPSINVRTREALLGWLDNLQSLQLFGKTSTPEWRKLMKPGQAVILDLSETVSLQKKQIIVDAVLRHLFELRREGTIPPTIVFLEEAHQFCLSEDTQILTKAGWKKFTDIKIGELAFSYNRESEKLELNEIERIIVKDYEGDLIKLFNKHSIEALVTEDHRVLCNYRTTGKDRKWCWSKKRFVQARNLPSGIRIPLAAEIDSGTKCNIDDDLIKILGWIITDGTLHYSENGKYFSYEISQSDAKKETLAEMRAVIRQRFPEVSIYKQKREDRIFQRAGENIFYFKSEATKEIDYWLQKKPKRIPRKILEDASLTQLRILFDAMVQGDGNISYSNGGYKYVTYYAGKNQELADDFQELCVRLGLSAIQKNVPQNNQIKILVSFKRKYAYIRKIAKESYSGKVWDITIKNGSFVARRNGKVFFTGNCPEARRALAFSKGILETVAREGRKYNLSLCIISQRPVRLSTTVLSQCGTNVFLRITNPYDLDHIRATSEKITKATLTSISSLTVGEALVVGQATRFPVFIQVRKRVTKETAFGEDFETVAQKFDKKERKTD
jgi:DNA helicase HerA-like ATPase